jgi:hypothetical protein
MTLSANNVIAIYKSFKQLMANNRLSVFSVNFSKRLRWQWHSYSKHLKEQLSQKGLNFIRPLSIAHDLFSGFPKRRKHELVHRLLRVNHVRKLF